MVLDRCKAPEPFNNILLVLLLKNKIKLSDEPKSLIDVPSFFAGLTSIGARLLEPSLVSLSVANAEKNKASPPSAKPFILRPPSEPDTFENWA